MICCLGVYSQQSDYMIKGEIISCSGFKDKPSGYIYLLKDSKVIDSVWTYHQTLFGDISWTNGKFKFKGLQNGIYQIKYEIYFDTQDFPTFEISNSDLKDIEICYDKLPERLYKEETSLDRLEINDTLFINVYIAAGGEFGGYDEGLWIVKEQDGFIGRYYNLPSSQTNYWNSTSRPPIGREEVKNPEPLSDKFELSESDLIEIKRFLIEIKHYHEDWISNAPEYFYIKDKYEKIFRVKHNSHYQPYLKLRERINNGL